MKIFLLLFSTLLLFSQSSVAYNVNLQKISVSGISSGAYFANQMHVAYSKLITGGTAMIAGGPYYCSEGNGFRALNVCMKTNGSISTDGILSKIAELSKKNLIDDPILLKDAKIFLLSGKNDNVVFTAVTDKAEEMYLKLGVPKTHLKYVKDLAVGHAFPTLNYGNSCPTPKSPPYISKCDYDTAFEILNFFEGPLNQKVNPIDKNLHFISQTDFFDPEKTNNSLAKLAALYVPTKCSLGEKCSLHVSFHGCMQSRDDIGDDYFQKLEFNSWAEANNIIILYPQAVKNYALGNPNSCWDWWGYTGPEFHNKNSVQMSVIYKLITSLIDTKQNL